MSWFSKAASSSIGRKLTMGLTGLFLVSFLVVHLVGNLQLFYADGGKAFNVYSHFMSTNGVIRILELGLVAGFVLHIYTSYVLTQKNKAARPIAYATPSQSKVSWFSKNMGLSGSIVLVFLIIHLKNFWFTYKFGQLPTQTYEGLEYKDMYYLVDSVFSNEWWYSILYIVAMILLGFHLNHGFQSAFRTFGLDHKKYTPLIVQLSGLISVVIPALFAAMPIYFMIK